MALPEAPPGHGERRRPARPLRRGPLPRLLQHPGPRGHRGPAGLHPGPASRTCSTGSAGAPGCRRSSGSATPRRSGWSGRSTRAGRSACASSSAATPTACSACSPPASTSSGTADEPTADRIHLLGTDRLGRDQWSRLMHGTQTSMTIGLVAVTLSVVLGVVLGGVSGYFGGLPDQVIQRRHRAAPVAPDHPHLARAHRRPAPRLDADPGLLRDHRHPLAGGLDHPRPRGAGAVPGAPGGGLRPGGRPGGLLRGRASSSATWCPRS